MQNSNCHNCGGCPFRSLSAEEYRQKKMTDFKQTVALIKNAAPLFDAPVFINDGLRRRADMAFLYAKQKLSLGFNEQATHNIADIDSCLMLDEKINKTIPAVKKFLEQFCRISVTKINKKKKIEKYNITAGHIKILHADNGLDILLELEQDPVLEHRLLIAEFVNAGNGICRFSWRIKNQSPETVVEILSPLINIAGCSIDLPHDVFLQASVASQMAMIEKVIEYMGNTRGKMADLFCGLGTFTYPLAQITGNEIIAVDSSVPSLDGLQKALNRNQLHNVTVINRNLFKYPFDAEDLSLVKAVVMDPPRAGAHEQCRELAKLDANRKPEKIIFISCNPKTFVYDAQLLIDTGYKLERITLIDQFVYSKHEELIALFTADQNKKGE